MTSHSGLNRPLDIKRDNFHMNIPDTCGIYVRNTNKKPLWDLRREVLDLFNAFYRSKPIFVAVIDQTTIINIFKIVEDRRCLYNKAWKENVSRLMNLFFVLSAPYQPESSVRPN